MTEIVHEPVQGHNEIHLPPPSFWPLVLGFGMFLLALGGVLEPLQYFPALANAVQKLPADWPTVGGFLINISAGIVFISLGVGGWMVSNIRERTQAPGAIAGDMKLAMWMFLGNEILFFTGLIATFLLLRAEAQPGVDHVLVESIPLVSLNTFILLTSSLTVVLAHDAAVRDKQLPLRLFLFLTIILGSAFIGLQGVEYSTLYAEGLKWRTSAYGTAFFTLTGTHGLHVIVGILWCAVIFFRALRGGFNARRYGGVEIFGLYWHFVDIVWILLFAIVYLMHTIAPET